MAKRTSRHRTAATRGRPREHTDEDLAAVIELMAQDGISLKEAAAKSKVPYKGLYWRIAKSAALSRLDARAREVFADAQVERMNEIAQDEPDVQRARLLCDNIKWYAARVLPKKYGDRQQLEHSGEIAGNGRDMSDREFGRRVAFVLTKAMRAKGRPEAGRESE